MQTPTPGTFARVYAGGGDLSPISRGIKPAENHKTEDFACLGDSWEKPFPVSGSANFTLEGFYEEDVDSMNALLAATLGVNNQVLTLVTQDVLGSVAYGLRTAGTAYDVSGLGYDTLVKVSAAGVSNVGLERLLVSHPMSEETAAGSGGVIDNGAATTFGLVIYAQVKSSVADGTANHFPILTVQDSANGSAWADLLVLDKSNWADVDHINARGAQRGIVVGTVRRYLRWLVSNDAGSPGWTSLVFSLALGRGTAARPCLV